MPFVEKGVAVTSRRSHNQGRTLILCAALTIISVIVPANGAAQIATSLTIGDFIRSMQTFVQTLESSARSLLDQGNNVAAQQQLLLAGTLKGTIAQLQQAYNDSMSKTFDKLDVAQGNAFKQLQMALADASKLENRSTTDLNQIVKNTQDAANQLMDRMPLTDKSPVYFGIQTKDVLSNFDPNPYDIRITGYHLVDPRLGNKQPTIDVTVADKTYRVAPDRLSVQFNRIDISLPNDLRDAIRIDNQPCDPMRLFHVAGTIYYLGGWFNTNQHVDFAANVLPGARLYSIRVVSDGTRTASAPVQLPFSNTSGEIQVGCENSASTTVQWNAPDGASQIAPQSVWYDTDNLKGQSSNAVASGPVASATGTVSGRDKQCVLGVCNCPGGGHGKLRLFGTYVVSQTVTSPFHDERQVTHVNPTHISIPNDGLLKFNTVDLEITRQGCSKVFDTIHFAASSDPNRIIQATSTNGYFSATLQPGQVDVQSTDVH